MRGKKAQDGVNAAILVAIIGALIVLYILFLPSGEREKLLDPDGNSVSAVDDGEEIIFREAVGQLTVGENLEDQKDIPSVFLFESRDAQELASENPFVVRKSAFSEDIKEMKFFLDTVADTDGVLLSFNLKEHEGTLKITLNGNTVFESDVDSPNVNPIVLQKHLLAQDNTLVFSVDGVGMKFWSTNEYALDNIRITGDITDRTKQEGQNIFILSDSEYENLDEAKLSFVVYCQSQRNTGVLDISVNGRNVFTGTPICDDPVRRTLPTSVLQEGTNSVIFKASRGEYSVEQIHLDLEFDKTVSQTYFFEMNQTFLDELEEHDDRVLLFMDFVDDDEDKRGTLDINDHFRSFDQEDKAFSLAITNLLRDGNNHIRILPETELNIIELRVEVEEK